MLHTVLRTFNLDPQLCQLQQFGSGLINHTWKVTTPSHQYILQRINHQVFNNPQNIANNLIKLGGYLQQTAPYYLFAAPLADINGHHLVNINNEYYRLSPFISNSHAVDFLTHSTQAYEAAKQFGKFTRLLDGYNPAHLDYTLPNFHNLSLRVAQFKAALNAASDERKKMAALQIEVIFQHEAIADTYTSIVNEQLIPLRVIHHDAKINNVLFNNQHQGLCVIDLDTVMPGYFISDVGDMMRTYLCAVNEDEPDMNKISIRNDFFIAVYAGYMEEMGIILTPQEKSLFTYSGKFMIYMQAVRFLTDYLQQDIYYQTQYSEHNLVRAKNQLKLLNEYLNGENHFNYIINQFEHRTSNPVY